jgi:hypothetical protein
MSVGEVKKEHISNILSLASDESVAYGSNPCIQETKSIKISIHALI